MSALAIRWRWAAGAAGAMLALTGLIGWLHTSAGLRLLAAAGVPCPVNTVSADRVGQLRAAGLATLRGADQAPARPVPAGLRLDVTTEPQAEALLARAHGKCEPEVRGYHYLRCRGLDAQALALSGPPVSEMWLSFNPAGKLVGVDIYRRGMAPDEVRTVWQADARKLDAALGAPSSVLGDPEPDKLEASAVQVARLQYRYADYVATVTAAHLPQTGLSVREQYLSGHL